MIPINIEQDTMEVYIQKKVKCPIIFWSHLVDTLVQYTAGKSKGKKENDNIKCSLFKVKSKWQQTEVETLKAYFMSHLIKGVDLKELLILNRGWELGSVERPALITTNSFLLPSFIHIPIIETTTVLPFVHRVQVQQDDVIPVNSSRLNDNEGN